MSNVGRDFVGEDDVSVLQKYTDPQHGNVQDELYFQGKPYVCDMPKDIPKRLITFQQNKFDNYAIASQGTGLSVYELKNNDEGIEYRGALSMQREGKPVMPTKLIL